MNLLSPNDFIHLPRRKSVCSGAILLNSTNGGSGTGSNNNNNNDISAVSTPSKKKERRRGSLSEPPVRRASLVQRWFKHITDAAEAYKARTKNNNTESTDDTPTEPPHTDSFTVDNPPESQHPPPQPIITPTEEISVPTKPTVNENVENEKPKQEDNIDYEEQEEIGDKNSNSTRTITQQCSLVAPSEVLINISPALIAEPVLTPAERLRRLDDSIRATLAEKQRIVCDMFRVPNEHFNAIADIAGQPEASQDPSDIVLSAFAQVQSLTEVLNDFIKVTTQQEISAVSTSVCDECYRNQNRLVCNNSNGKIPGMIMDKNVVSNIIEDEDGYCQIDELRSPGPIPPSYIVSSSSNGQTQNTNVDSKRQSTVSADSIPEETEHDINVSQPPPPQPPPLPEVQIELPKEIDNKLEKTCDLDTNDGDEILLNNPQIESHIEINDAYDSTSQLSELNQDDESTLRSQETQRFVGNPNELCGSNRLAHVANILPAVPCHLITGYVSVLNEQISRLLPKLEERDIERDNLRKENQHLRELLNAIHDKRKEKVSESEETSTPITSTESNSHD